MKTLKFKGNQELELEEVTLPDPNEDEVLLEVAVSAFCGSERGAWTAENGSDTNPGHEFTGVVAKAGANSEIKAGERVTVHVTSGCGKCYYCRIGMQQFCREMKIIEGGHATHVVVPAKACLPIPEDMSHEEAVLLFGDTIGVGYRAIKRLDQEKETPVLVFGAGPIGLGVAALLKYYGYKTIIFEVSEYRREYVKKAGLAEWIEDPTQIDPAVFLAPLTDGVGPATIIECTGNASVIRQSVDLIRCGGTLILAGVNEKPLDLTALEFIFKELTVSGVWYQSDQDMAELTQIWRNGFDPLLLISHRGTAEGAVELGKMFFEGKTAKTVVHWQKERTDV